jgi:hypothetical protein
MTGIVISSGCEKSFPAFFILCGERKVMKHFVVNPDPLLFVQHLLVAELFQHF